MSDIPFAPWMRGNRALDMVRNAAGPTRSVAPLTYYSAVLAVHEKLSGEVWSAEAWVATARTKLMEGDLQAAEAALMRDLSRAYPNITVISVRDAIAQVTGLMGQVVAAITYGALITLVTGAVVLIGAAAAGERARTYEAAVLKTLGASRARVLANFALRSAILGAAAGIVAVFAGGIAGWAVSRFVMETDFVFEPVSALVIVVGGVAVTTLAGLAFAWRPLSARPARVLRARE